MVGYRGTKYLNLAASTNGSNTCRNNTVMCGFKNEDSK